MTRAARLAARALGLAPSGLDYHLFVWGALGPVALASPESAPELLDAAATASSGYECARSLPEVAP